MNCPNQQTNKEQCSCPSKDCERNGLCCKCVAHHRKQGSLPFCLRELKENAG
ncbi:MAG: hypothetical protein LBB36_06915 [Fibromonadaceae bacterium]|nr:hypothetical protein [Fibromonadaceae bacterium]